MYICIIPYRRKYWRSLNLAVWSRAAEIKTLADLNLAVRYRHTIYAHTCTFNTEILADFNLAVVARTAKPPSLTHRQIFRLYSSYTSYYIIYIHVYITSSSHLWPGAVPVGVVSLLTISTLESIPTLETTFGVAIATLVCLTSLYELIDN